MIGVIGDFAGRYTWFSQCLADLRKPEGSEVKWRMGGNQALGRNLLVKDFLASAHDWLFFIDDDQAFAPSTLERLLSHGYPVVSALILQRGAPFLPTAYAEKREDSFYNLDLRSVTNGGLVQVRGCGTGGLLLRRDVLNEVIPPWFVYNDKIGEDLYFSDRLHNAGFQILVDTGCSVGHIAPAAVFPEWDGAQWLAVFRYSDGTEIRQPLQHDRKQQ
jgi:hypothetical protein